MDEPPEASNDSIIFNRNESSTPDEWPMKLSDAILKTKAIKWSTISDPKGNTLMIMLSSYAPSKN